MGMFDSLYDERGQEWQTKAYECGLCRFSIGDTMPPVDGVGNTYQVEVLGDGPDRWFIDGFATVSDGTLVHIDEYRDPGLPLLDYYGDLIPEDRA